MISRWPSRILTVAVLLVASVVGYRLLESRITVGVYRDRLKSLSRDYENLRDHYNQAVRKTAVTELLVKNNTLCVVIRTAEGELKRIETPFDPRKEIYVDYAVIDGRLWVRRVFDATTPPEKGVVIDPKLVDVNWNSGGAGDAGGAAHGKAVYRSLSDGRWVVTVTGDGSLTLAKAEGDAPTELSPPPEVRDYEQIEKQVKAEVEGLGAGEVVSQLFH